MAEYRKLLMGIVGAVVYGLYSAVSDNRIDAPEWVGIGTYVLAAVVVWRAPNTALWGTAKTWVHALGTGTILLQVVIVGGITASEMLEVFILIASTAGVYLVPNKEVFRPNDALPRAA